MTTWYHLTRRQRCCANSKIILALHINYTIYLFDCKQIWLFSADFNQILQYQISRKSVQWKPS